MNTIIIKNKTDLPDLDVIRMVETHIEDRAHKDNSQHKYSVLNTYRDFKTGRRRYESIYVNALSPRVADVFHVQPCVPSEH